MFLAPLATICLPRAFPSTLFGGASRKYHLEMPVSASSVLAGENMTVPEAVTVDSTFSVTEEDSAPRMAETLALSSFWMLWLPTVGLVVSLESVEMTQAACR